MPLIILGIIVIVAVILIFNSINTGVKKKSNDNHSNLNNSSIFSPKAPVDEGKVIFLYDDSEDEETEIVDEEEDDIDE